MVERKWVAMAIIVFASILFPVQAFVLTTTIANLGTSNGDEPVMLSPFCCIIPVLFALVIGSHRKSSKDNKKTETQRIQ